MAINVTVRDIIGFPGGTAKTITLDIAQIVPNSGNPEGDEIWVTTSTTTATASGGGSIQDSFKNEMKRGFLKGVPPTASLLDISGTSKFKVAIDEDISSGVDITLTNGTNLLPSDVAQDIETLIKNLAEIGLGGGKEGNLSYLNAQVRFIDGIFSIESGTVTERFTGAGRSSVNIAAPGADTDIRTTLGLHLTISSEQLAARQLAETSLASDYTSGDIIEVTSAAGFIAGDPLEIRNVTSSQIVLVSGAGVTDGLTASQIRFVVTSGISLGLASAYSSGSQIRKLHLIDQADPVSAITTVDQLYRAQIDGVVNQIDFSA